MMQTNKTGFEIKSCNRCGGSGSYSYCQMHGSTCFGCGGTGFELTKRGAAARAKMIELQTRPVDAVKVGDYCWVDNRPFARAGWLKVLEIGAEALNANGRFLEFRMKNGETLRYHVSELSTFRCVTTDAERADSIKAALEYQSTLDERGNPMRIAA